MRRRITVKTVSLKVLMLIICLKAGDLKIKTYIFVKRLRHYEDGGVALNDVISNVVLQQNTIYTCQCDTQNQPRKKTLKFRIICSAMSPPLAQNSETCYLEHTIDHK